MFASIISHAISFQYHRINRTNTHLMISKKRKWRLFKILPWFTSQWDLAHWLSIIKKILSTQFTICHMSRSFRSSQSCPGVHATSEVLLCLRLHCYQLQLFLLLAHSSLFLLTLHFPQWCGRSVWCVVCSGLFFRDSYSS